MTFGANSILRQNRIGATGAGINGRFEVTEGDQSVARRLQLVRSQRDPRGPDDFAFPIGAPTGRKVVYRPSLSSTAKHPNRLSDQRDFHARIRVRREHLRRQCRQVLRAQGYDARIVEGTLALLEPT
jgi:hypothetical protein